MLYLHAEQVGISRLWDPGTYGEPGSPEGLVNNPQRGDVMRFMRFFPGVLAGFALTVFSGAALGAQPGTVTVGSAGVIRYLEKGQPPVVIHLTVEQARGRRAAHGSHGGPPPRGQTTNDLIYNGGTGGTGVETAPKIYLVLWGSQWTGNDPSGEVATLESFLYGMGGSSWLNTATQYCQGVKKGTIYCNGAGTAAGNQAGMFPPNNYVNAVWQDNGSAAPNKPKQSQIAAEAVKAAQHFGNTGATANDNAQYVIATASGYNSTGFGSQYCAYHSYTTSSYGDIAYTNLPYITDAGASCGANFNGLGPDAGITIVEGHEAAETITDQFPSYGWLDSGGSEIGDKCAWIAKGQQGASANVTFPDGATFPVQSLWSNAFNSGGGGCVMTYP